MRLALSGREGRFRRMMPGSCLYSQQRTRSRKRRTSACLRRQSSSTYCRGREKQRHAQPRPRATVCYSCLQRPGALQTAMSLHQATENSASSFVAPVPAAFDQRCCGRPCYTPCKRPWWHARLFTPTGQQKEGGAEHSDSSVGCCHGRVQRHGCDNYQRRQWDDAQPA